MKLPPLIYNSIGKFFFFILLELACILLVMNNGDVQKSRIMNRVRSFQAFFWKINTSVKNYTNLKKLNAELSQENAKLLSLNTLYKEQIIRQQGEQKLEELTAAMRQNLGDSTLTNYRFVLAKVVKNTINTEHNYLVIDKGREDGITEDLGVITPSGVVGIVRAVGAHYSYVLSFLNQKQHISAKVGQSQALGTLLWEGKDIRSAVLTGIPLSEDVKQGDIVYTSGSSAFFPPDIPVGYAKTSTIEDGIHKRVDVELILNYSTIDYVIVVKDLARAEIEALINDNR